MKIAFAADPLASFKIEKDSTYAMMVEAARRGHALYSFGHADLIFDGRKVLAYLSRVRLTGNPQDWFHQDEPVLMSLNDVDAVIERTDPPFNMEYVYATYLLERAEADGARIFNRPGAIRSHNEKLAITGFTQFIAPTLVTSKEASIRDFHREHRDIILKPLDGMGGEGVFRVGEQGLNLGAIIETLTQHGARTIMVQRYIPEIVDGDRRVLLIGGQVVAMPVSAREREIAETLAPVLYQRGLLLVGLDVIGNYLTEINVTSPTCFQEIAEQTGFDVAGMFIDALERTLAGG